MSVTRAIDFSFSNRKIVADILNEIRIFNRYSFKFNLLFITLFHIILQTAGVVLTITTFY